jgi:protein gp37
MAANSAIEWTDHTFNPWRGCTKVHAGCTNCYAEVNYSVKMHGVKWGPNGTRVKLSHAGWKEPLKWNREAEAAGERRRVFCASLADVFEDWQGPILHRMTVMYFIGGPNLEIRAASRCGARYKTRDARRSCGVIYSS